MAQLVARLHGMQKVRGSNPLSSTGWSSRFSEAYFTFRSDIPARVLRGCSRSGLVRGCVRVVASCASPGWFPGVVPLSACGVRALPGCSCGCCSGVRRAGGARAAVWQWRAR
jgi:hypothetical protein